MDIETELAEHKQRLGTMSARLAAAESELRRLRMVIEDSDPCWGVFDSGDSLVRVDLHSEIELADDGTYVRCMHLVAIGELEASAGLETGTTTMYGTVRVTGDERGVLTTGSGRTVPLMFVEHLHGAELRDNPGREFCIEGSADIDLETGAVCVFVIRRITEYRKVPISQAIEELREAAGENWDAADADRYLRELRED